MSDVMAGNSFVRENSGSLLSAIEANSILNAVNANGINGVQTTQQIGNAVLGSINASGVNGVQTTQNVGLAADATAQRIGLAAEATSNRGFHHADGTAQRMAVAELDAIGKVGDEVCDSSRDIMRDLHATDNHISGAVERQSLFNAGVTERTSDKTQSEVERFGLSELDAIRGAEKYLYAGMSQNAKDILMFSASEFERVKLQSAADTASIKQQQYEDTRQLLLQNCGDTASIQSKADSNVKDLLLQNAHDRDAIQRFAAENAKDAALTACNNVKDLIILGDRNTAAIQAAASAHKEELARQIAECCCEQKTLTLETSHQTQDLIRKMEDQRIRDELAKTREELIALRVRSTLTPSLVGSVPL